MSLTRWLAAENTSDGKRATIAGTDVLKAMEELSFEHYAKALRLYMSGYPMKSQQCEEQVDGQTSKPLTKRKTQQSPAAAD